MKKAKFKMIDRVIKILSVSAVLLWSSTTTAEKKTPKLSGSISAMIYCGNLECQSAALWVEGIFREYLGKKWLSPEELFALLPPDLEEKKSLLKKLYIKGKKAFDDLNPEQAQKELLKLINLSKALAPHLKTKELKLIVNSYLILGVIELMNGNNRKGREYLAKAIILSPSAKLKELIEEEDKLQIFKQVQKKITDTPPHTVTFKSYPKSEVFINGKFAGVTPLKYKLKPGEYYIVFKRDGSFSTGRFVNLTEKKVFRMNLKPIGEWKKWKKLGSKAALFTDKTDSYPHPVKVMAELTQTNYILTASVKKLSDKKFEVKAAIYNAETQRQFSWGGAIFKLDSTGKKIIKELIKKLAEGKNPKLNGWSPKKELTRLPPPPPKIEHSKKINKPSGSSAGLWIGLGLGAAAIVGVGTTFLILYLTRPKCPSNSGCLELELK